MNAECLHDIFKTRVVPQDLRTTNLFQPKRQSTTYGLRSLSDLGASLWNNIVKDFPFLITKVLRNLQGNGAAETWMTILTMFEF